MKNDIQIVTNEWGNLECRCPVVPFPFTESFQDNLWMDAEYIMGVFWGKKPIYRIPYLQGSTQSHPELKDIEIYYTKADSTLIVRVGERVYYYDFAYFEVLYERSQKPKLTTLERELYDTAPLFIEYPTFTLLLAPIEMDYPPFVEADGYLVSFQEWLEAEDPKALDPYPDRPPTFWIPVEDSEECD